MAEAGAVDTAPLAHTPVLVKGTGRLIVFSPPPLTGAVIAGRLVRTLGQRREHRVARAAITPRAVVVRCPRLDDVAPGLGRAVVIGRWARAAGSLRALPGSVSALIEIARRGP